MKRVYCKSSNDKFFHAGGWYNIIDGRIYDDDDIPRPVFIKTGTHPIETVEDIKNYKSGNWSWIGEFVEGA